MIIAELFVNLGIKGAEKTVGALSNVQKGMQNLGSLSLETKAAIVGAMYALERLFSKSGTTGTDLTNFSTLIGTSTKTLQQYQFAARQVGVSNQETEATFKTLASTMTKIRMGEGAPKGFAQVAMLTGGINAADVEKFMQNPELLLQRLQLYAQKEKRLGIRNEVLKSFGLSDNLIAGLARNAFNPTALARAPTYSDRELKDLDKANIAWANLGNTIAMAFGRFNAAHGGQLVKDLSLLTEKVLTLANAFLKLAEAAHVFEWLNKSVQGLSMLMDTLTNLVNSFRTPKGRQELQEDTGDLFKGIFDFLKEKAFDFFNNNKGKESTPSSDKSKTLKNPQMGSVIQKVFQNEPNMFNPIAQDGLFEKNKGLLGEERKLVLVQSPPSIDLSTITPNVSRENNIKTVTQNFNVNQNFTYSQDANDQSKSTDHMKKAVTEAFRQLSSQVQGS